MKPASERRDFLRLTSGSAAVLAAASLWRPHVLGAQQPDRIKVGQIGTAHAHAAGKLETLRKLSDTYDVVGVVEPDPHRRQVSQQNPVYRDVRWISETELLETPGLQCVAVETEIKHLVPTAQRCIDAALHVHLDKPAGESLSALRRLHDSATAQDRCVQMGYMFRYNPAFELIQRAVDDGWLGTVFELHAVMSKQVGSAERESLSQYPGGTMFELGCHLIDAMVSLMGKPDQTTAVIHRTLDDGLADNMLAVLQYPRASATVRSSVLEPFGFRRRQFTVVGTEGVADIRPLEPARLELSLTAPRGDFAKGTQVASLPQRDGRYDGDFHDLAAVIRGQKRLAWDAEHDLATHETILRASGYELS